jgi:chromosome segregation protein
LQAKVAKSGEIGDWLKARGLADAKPLWQAIQVEAGWETAVEAVLRERFSALAADADVLRAALLSPPPAILTLALHRKPRPRQLRLPTACAARCAATIRAGPACSTNGWPASPSATTSPAELPLGSGQRVSRAGHLLTPAGLTLYVPDAKTHGVIERQREIDELAGQVETRIAAEDAAREVAAARRNRSWPTCPGPLTAARRAAGSAAGLPRGAGRGAQAGPGAGPLRRALGADRPRPGRTASAGRNRTGAHRACRGEGELQRDRLGDAARAPRTRDRPASAEGHGLARCARRGNPARARGSGGRLLRTRVPVQARRQPRAAATADSQLQRIEANGAAARTELAGISDSVCRNSCTPRWTRAGKESALAERRNVLETMAADLRGLDEQRLRLEQGLSPLRDSASTTCGSRRRPPRSTRSSSANAWPRSHG